MQNDANTYVEIKTFGFLVIDINNSNCAKLSTIICTE